MAPSTYLRGDGQVNTTVPCSRGCCCCDGDFSWVDRKATRGESYIVFSFLFILFVCLGVFLPFLKSKALSQCPRCFGISAAFAAVRLLKFWGATSRTAIHNMAVELPHEEAELEERLWSHGGECVFSFLSLRCQGVSSISSRFVFVVLD